MSDIFDPWGEPKGPPGAHVGSRRVTRALLRTQRVEGEILTKIYEGLGLHFGTLELVSGTLL